MEIRNELNLPKEVVQRSAELPSHVAQRIAEHADEDVLDTLDWEATCGTRESTGRNVFSLTGVDLKGDT